MHIGDDTGSEEVPSATRAWLRSCA